MSGGRIIRWLLWEVRGAITVASASTVVVEVVRNDKIWDIF